ncbi:hypothetical protein PCL_01424 [Purpureocillium lilacinum]|uniref:Uncharacterized protein n=1 Tax=Purpureocillium lilacinum TaxID=33203 RepID=A0A2U3E3H6_PURLI|nr:hypothetical protein PCL_01424 [Purpureocillium lilacinum]
MRSWYKATPLIRIGRLRPRFAVLASGSAADLAARVVAAGRVPVAPVASALEEEIEADDDERAGDGYAEADDELCALAVAAAVLGREPAGADAAAGGACCRRAAKQGGNLPAFSRQLGALITGGPGYSPATTYSAARDDHREPEVDGFGEASE